MILKSVELGERGFLIQFFEIMHEFGGVIPWLDGMDELRFATNGRFFCEELMRRTGQDDAPIMPFQLVDSDPARTYLGGIIHFPRSPERLVDRRNLAVVERLTHEGASFISCLQVRDVRRGRGIGNTVMTRALRAILRSQGAVWGVVSNPALIPWYRSLGAQVLSPLENRDGLWIVHWKDGGLLWSDGEE